MNVMKAVHLLYTKNAHKILINAGIWYLCLFCDVIQDESKNVNQESKLHCKHICNCDSVVQDVSARLFENGSF